MPRREDGPLFCAPQPTPFDLCFRLFGFPVRVHPMFWLTTLVLGPTSLAEPNAGFLFLIWVACVFVSILFHELGHAFAFRYYRCEVDHISFYWLGGLAIPVQRPRGHWPNIFIALAGPAAQLLICAALYLSNQVNEWAMYDLQARDAFQWRYFLYAYLFSVSLYWALFNLLPIWPLDGGQVCQEVCRMLRVRGPEVRALKISIVTAVAVLVIGLAANFGPPEWTSWIPAWLPFRRIGPLGLLLVFALAYGSYEQLQEWQRSRGYADRDW